MQTVAIQKAFLGLANTIGISMMSGGIGKTELSAKETPANAELAWRWEAKPMIRW